MPLAPQMPPETPLAPRAESTLGDLHVRLLKRLTQSPTLTDVIADAALEVTSTGIGVGFFHAARGPEGELAPPTWVAAPADAARIADGAIAAACSDALSRTRLVVRPLSDVRGGVVIAAGIYFRGRAPEVIGVVANESSDLTALASAVQLAATSISLWGATPRTPSTAASLADRCIAVCQDAESHAAVYERLALYLGDALSVSVCIGERRASGGARLLATNAVSRVSKSSSLARAATEALAAVVASGEEQLWVFRDAINNEQGPVMSFALAAEAEFAFATPLGESGAAPQYAILLFGALSAAQLEKSIAELRAAKPKLAAFLTLLKRVSAVSWSRWLAPILRPFSGSRKLITIPLAAAVTVLLFVPVTDSAPATCSVEPMVRRYVVSPQEGLLAKSLVEPGQKVEAGQVLALLDRHALELEIAAQEAALAQAEIKRDAAMARGEAGQAGIYALEAKQADENLALLELRLNQLSIRSPISGVVLRGDLQRTIGAPVERGQVLFEVAPLDGLVAEIAIPEEEIHRVAPGMPVTARLDAFSGIKFQGVLEKIHPRAEVRDDASVFVGEMKLDPGGAPVLPGMQGRASISTARSPLIWSWIRRPLHRLMRRIGW